ncbi:hypothetical protein LTR50_003066 [Elasticomyces elasticus]|nr:hypothetical protein LTR50_003066 [Elasticomyces elasticus]
MSTPSAKRLRVDAAVSTLSKPFRSPLKSAVSARKESLYPNTDAINISHKPYLLSTLAHTVHKASPLAPTATQPSERPSLPQTPFQKSTTVRTTHLHSSLKPSHNTAPSTDAELSELTRTITRHETALRALRDEIDTLTQAASIATSDQDDELDELVTKWRMTSQAVAEEVFGGVKERVNRMGGVGAWRERERERVSRMSGWEEERRADAAGDSDEEDEDEDEDEGVSAEDRDNRAAMRDDRRRMKREMREAMEGEKEMVVEREKKMWEEEGRDDDVSSSDEELDNGPARKAVLILLQTFTMDMMLRSLNIDLEVIGYDRVAQRWII